MHNKQVIPCVISPTIIRNQLIPAPLYKLFMAEIKERILAFLNGK